MSNAFASQPGRWTQTTLGEICEVDPEVLGASTPRNFRFRYIDISSVSPLAIAAELQETSFALAPSRARKKVRKDDVLMATVRPNLKAFARVKESENLVASTGFAVLRAREGVSDPKFIEQVLFTPEIESQIEGLVAGSNYPAITISNVKRLKLLAPPLKEQRRIADLLSAVDEQISQVQSSIAKMAVLKGSVVREALGRLEGAPLEPLAQLAEVGSGITLGRKFSGAGTADYPYLRVANVQDGHIDLAEVKTLRLPESVAAKSMLKPGDVLMNEGGDFDKLGRGAVWHGQIPNCLHQNHVFRVRCNQSLLIPEFLALWAASEFGKKFFVLASKQSTNLASINSTQLKKFPVLRPSLSEQQDVLQVVDALNSTLETEMKELKKLRLLKQGLAHDLIGSNAQVFQNN